MRFGRYTQLFLLSCVLVACGALVTTPAVSPTITVPASLAREAEVFPVGGGRDLALQPMLDELTAAHRRLLEDRYFCTWVRAGTLGTAGHEMVARREYVAVLRDAAAKASLFISVLNDTRPVFADFDRALEVSVAEAGGWFAGQDDAVLWLWAESLAGELCGGRGPGQVALAALRWATDFDLIYQTVLAVGDARFVDTSENLRFWNQQPDVVGAFTELLGSATWGASADATGGVSDTFRLDHSGLPRSIHFGETYSIVDAGTSGSGNGRIDPGELVRISLSTTVAPDGETLRSESLFLVDAPPCIATLGSEAIVPELEPGQTGPLVLPPIYVSRECAGSQTLVFAYQSSDYSHTGSLIVHLEPSGVDLAMRPVPLEEDDPGFSRSNSEPGLGPGQRAELQLAARSSVDFPLYSTRAILAAADSPGPVALVDRSAGAMNESSRGRFASVDDLDLIGADSPAFESAVESREQNRPFTALHDRVWLRVVIRGAWSSVEHRDRVGEHLSPDSVIDSIDLAVAMLSDLDRLMVAYESAMTQLELTRLLTDPDYANVVDATVELVDVGALQSDQLALTYEYLDELQHSPLPDLVYRRRGRQLIIAALLLQIVPEGAAERFIRRLDVFALEPTEARDVLLNAYLEFHLASLGEAFELVVDSELVNELLLLKQGLDAQTMAELEGRIEPVPGRANYRFVRYLSIPLAAR